MGHFSYRPTFSVDVCHVCGPKWEKIHSLLKHENYWAILGLLFCLYIIHKCRFIMIHGQSFLRIGPTVCLIPSWPCTYDFHPIRWRCFFFALRANPPICKPSGMLPSGMLKYTNVILIPPKCLFKCQLTGCILDMGIDPPWLDHQNAQVQY